MRGRFKRCVLRTTLECETNKTDRMEWMERGATKVGKECGAKFRLLGPTSAIHFPSQQFNSRQARKGRAVAAKLQTKPCRSSAANVLESLSKTANVGLRGGLLENSQTLTNRKAHVAEGSNLVVDLQLHSLFCSEFPAR